MNIYRNPFIIALWAPVYQLVATIAITNDFLMMAIFIMFTLGLLGAYVSDFPVLSTLYMNEVSHKTAVSSLLGMLLGFILFLAFGTGGNEGDDGGTIDAGHVLLTKPSEINWPNAHLKLIQNGNDLIVSTDSIAYGIRLQSDIDGRFTENGFLLLPGNENARHVQFLPTHHEGTTLGVHSARHFAQFQ